MLYFLIFVLAMLLATFSLHHIVSNKSKSFVVYWGFISSLFLLMMCAVESGGFN